MPRKFPRRGPGHPKSEARKVVEIQFEAMIREARAQRWTRAEWDSALLTHRGKWLRPSSTGTTPIPRETYYAALRAIIGPVRHAAVGGLAQGVHLQTSMRGFL